jgi:uncharacterized protein (DUF488 family)
MLRRQKILLALLDEAARPVSLTVFVKLSFLLRAETEVRDDSTFYAFVPYRFGPFSFALYRELDALRGQSYLTNDDNSIGLDRSLAGETRRKIAELPDSVRSAVRNITSRYASIHQKALLRDVYARFPWYATKSELTDLLPPAMPRASPARPAVYTAGYERESVDGFFDRILRAGIRGIADVRANPVSRKYGFARSSLSGIAGKLGIDYRHHPQLGIPSAERATLTGLASYQRLLDRYESQMLPRQTTALAALCEVLREKPTALLCVEHDVRCCHRSRLANAVAAETGLPVKHL